MSAVLFSVAPDYYRAAVAELRRTLDVRTVRPVGEDAGIVESGADIEAVARACTDGRVRFVRHLAAVDAQVRSSTLHADPEQVTDWVITELGDRLPTGEQICLHVWDSGSGAIAPGKVRRALLEALMDHGIRVATSGAEATLAVCLGTERTTCGLTPSADALIDWAGGRIRLAAGKDQISRAEFKLEELFSLTGTPSGSSAIDLGAAPGGWTRILTAAGFEQVHAVDPADLDPRLAADSRVRHRRTTAGEFVHDFDDQVDLIVNDMRMVPHLTAHTMVDAAPLLHRDGLAVITFKLGTANPVKQTDESLDILSAAYEPLFIRQLQHNRQELTILARPV
ncbi:SAM-dependent methyltransferase [Dermacoccaceae bacterium W4C1]